MKETNKKEIIFKCNHCGDINNYEEKGFCNVCGIGTYEEIIYTNEKEGLRTNGKI